VQLNVNEAETQLSKLLELVELGEEVIIARHGDPVAQLVRVKKTGFPLGIAQGSTMLAPSDDWWEPMTDHEADAWAEGR
jgi:hypothetical protein